MKDKSYIADFSLSTGLVVISVLVFLESLKLKPSEYEPLGPAALPKALSLSLILFSIPLIAQGFRKFRALKSIGTAVQEGTPAESKTGKPLMSLVTAISTVAYIFLIGLIGFRISTVVLLLFLGILLHRQERKVSNAVFFPTLFVLAVGMSQILYLVFTKVLVVNLP